MLNFSIKTPKIQLHQSFQMVKFLAYCYSELVLIQAHCSLNCKNKKKKKKKKKKKSFLFSRLSLLFQFFLLFPLSLLSSLSQWMWSSDGSSPMMILVRQWWSDNHGFDVVWWSVVVWWSPSVLSSLPLFSLLCSLFVGLMVSLYSLFSPSILSSLFFLRGFDGLPLSLFTSVIAASLLDLMVLVHSIVSSFILYFFR